MIRAKKTKEKKISSAKTKIPVKEYASALLDLKNKIQDAQLKAAFSVNKELIKLYWSIGKIIVQKQQNNAWGTNIIEKLAKDLQGLFPGIEGFSPRNVFRMRAFYLAYEKVTQAVSEFENLPIFSIPWGHNILCRKYH